MDGGQLPSPTPRLQLVRQVLRIFAETGTRVPIFIDKMLAANWADSQAIVAEATITLNYTSVLNVLFLGLAAILVIRAWRTGVGEMAAMMA